MRGFERVSGRVQSAREAVTGEELDELALAVTDEDRVRQTRVVEHLTPAGEHLRARRVEIVDPDRDVREPGLEECTVTSGERFRLAEREQLEHEAVATQVDGPQSDGV